MRLRAVGVLLLALVALLTARLDTSEAGAPSFRAPFASGDGAANMRLNDPARWVVTRWVARHTGVLQALYLRVKLEGASGCSVGSRLGYAAGTSGKLLATTHPVLASGVPDLSVTLASSRFRPCGHNDAESIGVGLNLPVVEGQEFATVVRNVDGSPAANYFSQNFLYVSSGLVGANGRNERNPSAAGTYYGLDPRELVGFSPDAGRTWLLPGGTYGVNGGKVFVPTYVQQFADGDVEGQPYFSSTPVTGDVTMVYRTATAGTIGALGAYTSAPGSAQVRLSVDGVTRATALLSGTGFLDVAIPPVTVAPGQVVTVSTMSGPGGLALRENYAALAWVQLMQLGDGRDHYLSQKPRDAVPVYPIMQ